jgi:hypothetical protein
MRDMSILAASLHISVEIDMHFFRPVTLLLLLALGACATQPAPDLTPPPRKPADAKTQLESGRQY